MDVDLKELTGLKGSNPMNATIQALLDDPSTSFWLKDALVAALRRDPIQAVNEAEALVAILNARADAIIRQGGGIGRSH